MKYIASPVFFIFSLLFSLQGAAQEKVPNAAIGGWTDHASYTWTLGIEDANGQIFVFSSKGLYSYDPKDQNLERYSKIEGLSDAEYSTIAYSEQKNTLVIAYKNSNIDLYVNGTIYNVSGLKEKNMQGDKTIYSISFNGKYAYLACGFGILVIDLDKKEIHDTYVIGDSGTYLKINSITFTNNLIVAATAKGVYSANKNSAFLANYTNWKRDETLPHPSKEYKDVVWFGNKLVVSEKLDSASQNDRYLYTLYANAGNSWDSITTVRYISLWTNKENLLLTSFMDVFFFNTNLQQYFVFTAGFPFKDALLTKDQKLWTAYEYGGLVGFSDYKNSTDFQFHVPTGIGENCFRIKSYNDKVYIAPGGRDQHYNPRGIMADIYTLSNNQWSFLEGKADTLVDVLDISIDPNDPNHLFLPSWYSGLLEVKDNKIVKVYNAKNSPLQFGNEGIRVAGSAYDNNGNLWVLNSMSSHPLLMLRPNGTWDSVNTDGFLDTEYDMGGIMIDFFYGYKWIYPGNNYNKIYVIDGENMVYINPNKGSNDAGTTDIVTTLVCDLEGSIWVGTNKGLKIIYNIEDVFTNKTGSESNKSCENLVYQKDGFVQNLLGSDYIASIVIDGANRKWVGTKNSGAFLFSADGTQELLHFTAENSPLPSNSVVSVSVHHQTGNVYFGTEKGVVSYKGDATSYKTENENVHAYPNPVRPNYEGEIAIKGLVRDATVRISDISGNVVYNTKSNGGQAVWNGRNMNGQKVKSGVYLVFINDDDYKEKAVTKILFIK